MTNAILILAAGLLYLASFASVNFGAQTESKKRRAFAAALAGFTFHTAALALRYWRTGCAPVATSYDLLESVAWIFAAVQIAVARPSKNGLAGIFSMLPAGILALLPLGCPMFAAAMDGTPKASVQFAAAHGVLAASSYAFMAAGAAFGALFLMQQKSLRNKIGGVAKKALPPLQTLERGTGAFEATAALAMLVSISAGIAAAGNAEIGGLSALKFAAGGALFAAQIAVCAFAATGILRGARLSKTAVMLFVAALCALVPIEIGRTLQ